MQEYFSLFDNAGNNVADAEMARWKAKILCLFLLYGIWDSIQSQFAPSFLGSTLPNESHAEFPFSLSGVGWGSVLSTYYYYLDLFLLAFRYVVRFCMVQLFLFLFRR